MMSGFNNSARGVQCVNENILFHNYKYLFIHNISTIFGILITLLKRSELDNIVAHSDQEQQRKKKWLALTTGSVTLNMFIYLFILLFEPKIEHRITKKSR